MAVVISLVACGGGDDAGVAPAATTDAPSTTVATATTVAPATTVAQTAALDPVQQFDAAVLTAVGDALVFAELRTACLQANDVNCLVESAAEIEAAEERALQSLAAVGAAAAVAGGNNPDFCEGSIDRTADAVRSDIAGLQVYAQSEATGAVTFRDAAATYNRDLTLEGRGQAGHEYATRLLVCAESVRSTGATTGLVGELASFLADEIRVRPRLSHKLWSMAKCVDVGPVNGLPCVSVFDQTTDPSQEVAFLNLSFEQVTGFEDYAVLPAECRAAVEQAAARLQSSYEIYRDLRERELVTTDPELGSLMALGLYQIDERRRGQDGLQYPFNESVALRCVEAALMM
jgi:hypothetical protein